MVPPEAAHDPDLATMFVGQHRPTVISLFVHPVLVMEGFPDEGRLHRGHEWKDEPGAHWVHAPPSIRLTVCRRTLISNGLPTTVACVVLRNSSYAPATAYPVMNTTAGRGGGCRWIAR
jgi:hypothetical protein